MNTSDNTPPAEMVAEYLCPVCGERATLHCASCGQVYCAEHVARGFAMGYAFVCVDCVEAARQAMDGEDNS
jgi:predicted RNA-binding Zn-ribbon protein involved in translation (DUF1610 family)